MSDKTMEERELDRKIQPKMNIMAKYLIAYG